MIVGLMLWLVFSVVYYFETNSVAAAFVKSFDISLVVGYTKYSFDAKSAFAAASMVNVFLRIGWYAVFVTTIVNCVARVR